MRRCAVSCAVVAGLCWTADARADLTPPARAEITLELSVDNQASLPLLRFVVTNCHPGQKPSVGVLDPDAPTVCQPAPGVPVRLFGFRIADLPALLELEKRDAPADEAAAFLAAKAKTCGQILDEDLVFSADTGVTSVAARYALEPGPKGGCKVRRVSATTSKSPAKSPDAASTGAPITLPSAAPAASASAPAPSASPSVAPAGCGCGTAGLPSGTDSWSLLLTALLGSSRRRRRGSGRPIR